MVHDIVYLLKNPYEGEELRYSLRSLANFPHDKVWFFGGMPDGLEPDGFDYHVQRGVARYCKSTYSLKRACLDERVSDPFWLFNDDFFIMQPVQDFPVYHRGDLREVAEEIRSTSNGKSDYAHKMDEAARILEKRGKPTLAYNVHCPMLIHKQGALEALVQFPTIQLSRVAYGNYMELGGVETHDFKVHGVKQPPPDWAVVSTSDAAFSDGAVGEYIRSKFTEPSQYERN